MKVIAEQITFLEVPDEVSISFMISGCPLKCKGCHSEEQDKDNTVGEVLNEQLFLNKLLRYKGMITCVCFLGGEWHNEELINYLKLARGNGLRTCLYTGLLNINEELKSNLDYLKTGPWIEFLGGLNSRTTNQRMKNLRTGEDITSKFWKD